MSKVLILVNEDWADEFNYPIISTCTNKRLLDVESKVEESEENNYEMYFGTNEYFQFSKVEVLTILSYAKEVTEDELNVLRKFGIVDSYMGLDIVDRLLEY